VSKPTPPLLSVRTAVVVILGLLCGTVVAGLSIAAKASSATAALAGLATAGAATAFFHRYHRMKPHSRREVNQVIIRLYHLVLSEGARYRPGP